jgi:hypothetical protein
MKRFLLLFALFPSVAAAQESCTLQTYASSWMLTGTAFSVKCPSGNYTGTLISTPARRFFRRGHLVLKFDQPVYAAGNTKKGEGKFLPNRKQQIASMFLTGGASIGAKDLMDGWTNFIFPKFSVYTLPVTFGAMAMFEKGGDVNLKPGFKLQILQTRAPATPTSPTPSTTPSTP